MIYQNLELSQPAESILLVLLNRPRQFNSLNEPMMKELHHVLDVFETSSDQFLILSGAGRAFCFGADFQEFQNKDALPSLLELFQELILKLYYCSKITIARLNGFATGAGLDLALACDFRLAAEKIKLGEAYISMGLVPDGGGTFFLPRLIGKGRALEMLIRGEAISSEEAVQIGLIHRVFPPDQIAASTLSFVQELFSKPATARQLIKKLVKNESANLEEALQKENEAQRICFQDADHLKLAEEFLSKRRK